jgi:hypothetical protein
MLPGGPPAGAADDMPLSPPRLPQPRRYQGRSRVLLISPQPSQPSAGPRSWTNYYHTDVTIVKLGHKGTGAYTRQFGTKTEAPDNKTN